MQWPGGTITDLGWSRQRSWHNVDPAGPDRGLGMVCAPSAPFSAGSIFNSPPRRDPSHVELGPTRARCTYAEAT